MILVRDLLALKPEHKISQFLGFSGSDCQLRLRAEV